MSNDQNTFDMLKLIISLLTPLSVLILGLSIAKKLEKNKLGALKEKEWQVKWAEMFLIKAIEFNDKISLVVICIDRILRNKNEIERQELTKAISTYNFKLNEIEWDIQNYTQFSKEYGVKVNENQKLLMASILDLLTGKISNLEDVRKLQIQYNESVRKVHGDLLNMKL